MGALKQSSFYVEALHFNYMNYCHCFACMKAYIVDMEMYGFMRPGPDNSSGLFGLIENC